MTLLSPSLTRIEIPLVNALQLANDLGCKSVHIDTCHNLKFSNFFELQEVQMAKIKNCQVAVTVHVFQLENNTPPILNFLRPIDLAVLHVFQKTTVSTIDAFLKANLAVGCRLGLAIDVKANIESITPFLVALDTIFVMAIQAGRHNLKPDIQLLERINRIRTLITSYNPQCRIGIDGGVNSKTFSDMVRLADELVIESILFHADDLFAQWINLQKIAKRGDGK
jgi:pentose-5-phosphate-3-epimerase